jgi:PKD repeat protein
MTRFEGSALECQIPKASRREEMKKKAMLTGILLITAMRFAAVTSTSPQDSATLESPEVQGLGSVDQEVLNAVSTGEEAGEVIIVAEAPIPEQPLQAPPHLDAYKSVSPTSIYLPGEGLPDTATVNLTVKGDGDPYVQHFPVDVMLVMDRSGSMSGQDIIDAKAAANSFLGNLHSTNDYSGLSSFASSASLDKGLDNIHLISQGAGSTENAVNGLVAFGTTAIGSGILVAHNEISNNGRSGVHAVMIVLSDGCENQGSDPVGKATAAKNDGIEIFAIGLGGVCANTLKQVSTDDPLVPGYEHYYYAPTSGDLDQIYQDISEQISKTAGTNVVVTDILAANIDYVPLTFSITPDLIVGKTITWNVGTLDINETWTVTFDITASVCGDQLVDVYPDSDVTYTKYDGTNISVPFPEVYIHVYCKPIADPNGPYTEYELNPVNFDGTASYDTDGTIVQYDWDLDGDGIFETVNAGPTPSFTWGDDYSGDVCLKVKDNDGLWSDIVCTTVTIYGIAPDVVISPPITIFEGDTAIFFADATDPGSDDLTFEWTFDYRPMCYRTTTHYNGVGPDPYPSPNINPMSASELITCTYGDNGVYNVYLTVTDDDGLSTTVVTTVTVVNLNPTAVSVDHIYVDVDFKLRVTGEKWHNVSIGVYESGFLVDYGVIERYPGNPNTQSISFTTSLDILQPHTLVIIFNANPDGNPINGQINGANPVWVTIDDTTLKHTFVVTQGGPVQTWDIPNMDDYIVTLGKVLTFVSSSSDHGSDDHTFLMHWDDLTPDDSNIYCNDMGLNPPPNVGTPDPFPSPGGFFPFAAQDVMTHTYTTAGTYTIVLTVTDDDAMSTTVSVTVTIS